MKPVTFKEHNVVFAKDQPEYKPLPAYRDEDGRIICCWKLTFKERFKLLLTGNLWHNVMTFNHPLQPQYLTVTTPFK